MYGLSFYFKFSSFPFFLQCITSTFYCTPNAKGYYLILFTLTCNRISCSRPPSFLPPCKKISLALFQRQEKIIVKKSFVWIHLRSRVRIPSSPSTLLCSQIIYYIWHYIEKRTKIKKSRPGLDHIFKKLSA